MRIAAINTTASVAHAPARIAMQALDAAAAAGHDTLMIYGRGAFNGPSHLRHYRCGTPAETVWHYLMSRINDSQGLHSRRSTRRAIEYLAHFRPDVVHLHNLHGHYLHVPMLARWLADNDISTIITTHDCWPYTGHCTLHSHRGCMQWTSGCAAACPCRDEYPATIFGNASRNYRWKEQVARLLPHAIVTAVSPSQAKWLRQSILRHNEVVAIPNAVDTSVLRPCADKVKGLILAVANRWETRKGIDDIIRLSGETGPDYTIELIGDYRGRLPGNVTAVGRVDDPHELARRYSRAEVFVNPSRGESFGMTTIEALACGTPVVVNDAPALNDVAAPGRGTVAEIVDTTDTASLMAAIQRAKEHSPEACRTFACDNHPIELMKSRYLELYQRIIPQQHDVDSTNKCKTNR